MWVFLSCRYKTLAGLIALLSLALALNAQTAQARVNGSEGSASTSGYVVTDPAYRLNPGDPSIVDAIQFRLSGSEAASTVMVKLSSDGSWIPCDLSVQAGVAVVSCNLSSGSPIHVRQLDELRVVASR